MTEVELCCPVAHEFAPDPPNFAIPASRATEFCVKIPDEGRGEGAPARDIRKREAWNRSELGSVPARTPRLTPLPTRVGVTLHGRFPYGRKSSFTRLPGRGT